MNATSVNNATVASSQSFRAAMRTLPTAVAVISTSSESGRPVGLTANSVASLSLNPPLVTWAIRRNSPLVEVFRGSRRFVVNLLAAGQAPLAARFASPIDNRFEGVAATATSFGLPRLEGCAAWLDCEMHTDLEIGDHVLFVGAVCSAEISGNGSLGWWAGNYFDPACAFGSGDRNGSGLCSDNVAR